MVEIRVVLVMINIWVVKVEVEEVLGVVVVGDDIEVMVKMVRMGDG